MKLRTDFVSNSSSSSFIVKADGNTPSIFRENAGILDFVRFVNDVLFRAVFEPFQDAEYPWYSGSNEWYGRKNNFNINNVVKTVPDEDFVKAFVDNEHQQFVLPECCAEYIPELCHRIMIARAIDSEHVPPLYENGKQSKELALKWQRDRDQRLDVERSRLQEMYSEMNGKIAELLKPHMGSWEFYRVELGDEDGAEQHGFDMVTSDDVKWYWTFCNH